MKLITALVAICFTYWTVTESAAKPSQYLRADPTSKGAGILWDGSVACAGNCRGSPKQYFCASNGRTLDSLCRVRRAQCHDPYLNVTAGKCPSSVRCHKERNHSLVVQRVANLEQFVNVPSCKKDGSYSPTQCNLYFGYCWCVTAVGKMVKDSTFAIGAPSSCGRSKRSKRRRCNTEADKASFALKLKKLISNDGNHMSRPEIGLAIRRKHQDMDLNGDSSLSARELKKLLKRYRKKLPRSCIKTFWKFCDFIENKLISLSEFGLCLGAIPNMKEWDSSSSDLATTVRPHLESPRVSNRFPHGLSMPRNRTHSNRQGTSPSFIPETCSYERQELLKGSKKNVNIPDCEGPGNRFWRQIQCHGSYCYCVDRQTGVPVPATAVHTSVGAPNCQIAEASPYVPHPIAGCPSRSKNKFLSMVQRVLIQEMAANRISEEGDNGPVKERAARWFFSYLDENRDNALGRKESKAFKKLLLKSNVPKKCLRKFTQHCDRNNDSKISTEEFIGCLEVRRPERLHQYSDARNSIDRLKSTDVAFNA